MPWVWPSWTPSFPEPKLLCTWQPTTTSALPPTLRDSHLRRQHPRPRESPGGEASPSHPRHPRPCKGPGHGAHRQLGHPAQLIPESGPRSQWGTDSFQGGIFCAFLATLAFVGARQCPHSVGRPGTIGASTAAPPVGLRLLLALLGPLIPRVATRSQGVVCPAQTGSGFTLHKLISASSKLLLDEGCRKTGDRDPAALAKAMGQKKPMRTGRAGEVVSMVTRNQEGAGQHWKRH